MIILRQMEHKVNEVFDYRFVLKEPIGIGAYSEVWLAMNMEVNMPVALKLYVQSSEDVKKAIRQWITPVGNIRHKNILFPMSFNIYDDKLYFVLPYCQNGSISRCVGTFNEEQTWKLLYDVANALALLHNLNPPIFHQRLIPDNILIADDGDFMISDFGLNGLYSMMDSVCYTLTTNRPCGNCTYKAPELFFAKQIYTSSSDIFSLGIIAFEMLTGEPPFDGYGGWLQLQGEEMPKLENVCSDILRLVIERCLKTNSQERPTAKQLHYYAGLALSDQMDVLKKEFSQKRKWYQFLYKLE